MPGNIELRHSKSLSESINKPVETIRVGKSKYNIELLRQYAESLPVVNFPIEKFVHDIYERHRWHDEAGSEISLIPFLENWEDVQNDPLLAKHVRGIKEANIEEPIWYLEGVGVIDGMHRLVKASLENASTIPVKVWKVIPNTARIYEQVKDE